MSKKSPKIAALIENCSGHPVHDAHYLGYFQCFNSQLYYEAHDVLEELWLADKYGPNGLFYKGLIQFAGAFVHLQKNRLGPASKLFNLALKNLTPYPSPHADLDVVAVCNLARDYDHRLISTTFTVNPLAPSAPPVLKLLG